MVTSEEMLVLDYHNSRNISCVNEILCEYIIVISGGENRNFAHFWFISGSECSIQNVEWSEKKFKQLKCYLKILFLMFQEEKSNLFWV